MIFAGGLMQEVLRQSKLTSVRSRNVDISITLPKGKMFELLLDMPDSHERHTSLNQLGFAGRCEIYESGVQIASFPVSSQTCSTCNWLGSGTAPDAYILTWVTKGDKTAFCTRELLNGGRHYDIKLKFAVPPKEGSSVWLHWIQHYIDKPGTRSGEAGEVAGLHLKVSQSP